MEQALCASSMMSAKDSNDDLLDSPHLGRSEYEFKDI